MVLCHHKLQLIMVFLIIKYFGIDYIHKCHLGHIHSLLKKQYTITEYLNGKQFYGIDISCDYDSHKLCLIMDSYIKNSFPSIAMSLLPNAKYLLTKIVKSSTAPPTSLHQMKLPSPNLGKWGSNVSKAFLVLSFTFMDLWTTNSLLRSVKLVPNQPLQPLKMYPPLTNS